MMKNMMKKMMMVIAAVLVFGALNVNSYATETTETSEDASPLTFELSLFTYEIIPDAKQADMPPGFTIDDWEYNGEKVKAGFTDNSHMVCVMAEDQETGYEYRFIYDPENDLFVPYFGTEIKNGYIYTIPKYEDAEIPYGFVEAYFVIQTVPMDVFMREDAELTQEEIAVGSLSEDNYLIFLMMDENGREVHYTYDLIDRTFQRSLLQKKDAEKVTELNEVIDELSKEIGILNANHAERMNKRLTLIGVLIAAIIIMAGIIINLMLIVSKIKKGTFPIGDEDDDDYDDEEYEEKLTKKIVEVQKARAAEEAEKAKQAAEDELEILDLDLED